MAGNDAGTTYPLLAPERVGVEDLKRLGLTTEVGWQDREKIAAFQDVAIAGHAPLFKGDMRLNIAATDEAFRQESIAEILGYVELVRKLPRLKKVNMHSAPRQWLDETQTAGRHGDYGLNIDGIRQIADAAAKWGIEIVLENEVVYWTRVAEDVETEHVDWTDSNQHFGALPEEWIQIWEDVGRPNVGLCLDTSHACTYAHTFADPDRRADAVMAFVARPELIRHVHWNDNYLYDSRGRLGVHVLLGKGTLPVELHRAVKGLDATLFLEHFYTIEQLEEELRYVARL